MLHCLSLQSHLFSPVFYQQPSASSPLCCTVKCCYHEGVDFSRESCVTTCAQTSPLCRLFGFHDLIWHQVRRQPHDLKHLSCDLIGETQTDCPTRLTGIPTSHTNTHTDPHVSNKGVGVIAQDLTCATTPRESCPLSSRAHTVTSVLLLVTK